MQICIDDQSGFCFGVVRAISEAEQALSTGLKVSSLGDVVHNRIEVQRLEHMGLRTITHDDIPNLKGTHMLIRAHGEPPSTYHTARVNGVHIIDATCPVVAALQKKVKEAYARITEQGGQLVILGKHGHAEVVGLAGQVDNKVIVIESEHDLDKINYALPIYFLSQTTQSIALFEDLCNKIRKRLKDPSRLTVDDTICRRVSSREAHLKVFAANYDVIVFVCGKKSSNGRVLFEICRASNSNSYMIEDVDELQTKWFSGVLSVGVCGATSTPEWLMKKVADEIKRIENEISH